MVVFRGEIAVMFNALVMCLEEKIVRYLCLRVMTIA